MSATTAAAAVKLDDTKRLLSYSFEETDPRDVLIDVLRASVELLSLDDNDFTWSSWKDATEALAEMQQMLATAEAGGAPDRSRLSVIFSPTGAMQEVSISSGWGEAFLEVAERYDYAEDGIWGDAKRPWPAA